MSKDKQIEEIYNDLCDAPTGSVNSDFTIGTLQESHTNLFIKILAGHLYSKDYRKSTDVAREIIETLESGMEEPITEWHKGYFAAISDVVRMLKKKYAEVL